MNTTRLPSLFAAEPFTLDDPFRSFMRQFRWEPAPEVPQILMDLTESDTGYVVTATLPGVKKEDIHVNIDGNRVAIQAEVRRESEQKQGERVLRSERYYGSVARSFQLASELDDARASARFEDGVLRLTLPKKAAPEAKRLQIQ